MSRFSCKSIDWYTPKYILERINWVFDGQIGCDPATAKDNPTNAKVFYTNRSNGLTKIWHNSVFLNPPYGKVIHKWLRKLHLEAGHGTPILALLPMGSRFSTSYWQRDVLNDYLSCICFIGHRVKFLKRGVVSKANIYDSAIYGYNIDPVKFGRAFKSLGKCLAGRVS